MIIEYSFLSPESGMTMNASVPNVVKCDYLRSTIKFVYMDSNNQPVEVTKEVSELISFALRK